MMPPLQRPPLRFLHLPSACNLVPFFVPFVISFGPVPILPNARRPIGAGQHRKGPERQINPFHFVSNHRLRQIARPKPTVVANPLPKLFLSFFRRDGEPDNEFRWLPAS